MSEPGTGGSAGGRRAGTGRRPERRRYGLLLGAAAASLAVQGIAAPGSVQQVVVTALAAVTLLLALRAADLPPGLITAAAAVAITAVALSAFDAATAQLGDGAARAMNAALVALGPPAIVVGIVRDLRDSGTVRLEAVLGVLALYMLIGMAFGFVYGALDRLGGEPFFAGGETATVSRCLYFSFATLTTTGYGDLVAASDLGHTLAIFEALLGQIYLVTVVSLIVGNLGHASRPPPGPDPR